VALVLFAIVGEAIYRVIVRTQRATTAQTEQTVLQANVRSGMQVLTGELREIGYDSLQEFLPANAVKSDLVDIKANAIQFKASRGLGFTCARTANEIWIRKPFYGFRAPKLTDSLYIFIERDAKRGNDDDWVPRGIAAIVDDNCAGAPALQITLGSNLTDGLTVKTPYETTVTPGGPVRVWEIMEYKLYETGGRAWLGARSVSAGEAVQPVVGPLTATTGLAFKYYNKTGGEVLPGNALLYPTIRSVEITLQGESERTSSRMGGGSDMGTQTWSMTSRVALRNNLRP
jgi:hypothetical protein